MRVGSLRDLAEDLSETLEASQDAHVSRAAETSGYKKIHQCEASFCLRSCSLQRLILHNVYHHCKALSTEISCQSAEQTIVSSKTANP